MNTQQGLFAPAREPGVVEVELPWPPSANHYTRQSVLLPSGQEMERAFTGDWREFWKFVRSKSRVMVAPTDDAKEYDMKVQSVVIRANARKNFDAKLRLTIQCFPPDRRRRDQSNVFKCVEDALAKAKVYVDDSQIKEHHAFWSDDPVQFGKIVVKIEELL